MNNSIRHIEHVEDLLFENGSSGALLAIDVLHHCVDNPHDITIKYDGSPSIIFGRNVDGQLVVTDKSGFYAKKYNGRPTTKEQLYDMFVSRGTGRETLAANMAGLWDYLENVVPDNFVGYIWGDMLWFGKPSLIDGTYIFKPNTITYGIKSNTNVGLRVARSTGGIMIHHRLDSFDSTPVKFNNIGSLNQNAGICIFTPSIVSNSISFDESDFDKLRYYVDRFSNDINDAIIYTNSDIHKLLKKFVNQCVRNGSFSNMTQQLIDYCRPYNLSELVINNRENFDKAFLVFSALSNIKLRILSQINKTKTDVFPMTQQEGFVVYYNENPYKLVDRMDFSRRNFAKNDGKFNQN